MYRAILEKLIAWKAKERRRLLLLKGAKGIGKTWILREFGRSSFEDVLYVDCTKTQYMSYIAKDNLEPERILRMLGIYHGRKIKAGETLLIFDEIQCIPNLLKTLARFAVQMPEYPVCCAGIFPEGELPGLEGSVSITPEVYQMMPLNFQEFMLALKKDMILQSIASYHDALTSWERKDILEYVKLYYLIGGMPEAVLEWTAHKDFLRVRQIQREILEESFSACGLRMPDWENKDTILPHLPMEEAEARDALAGTGLLYRIYRIKDGEQSSCKTFVLDIGLKSLMSNERETFLKDKRAFSGRGKKLTEQFVWQELMANTNIPQLYFSEEETERMTFVFADEDMLVPVEVLAYGSPEEAVQRRRKSRYPVAVNISFLDMKQEAGLLTVPLYGVWNL